MTGKGAGTSGGWRNPHFAGGPGAARAAENLLRGESLRAKALSGCALGTFLIDIPAPQTVATLALAGFDFVVLDMEHSSIDFGQLETLIAAGHAAGIATLVRVWGEDSGLIGKALDLGANGVMAPHVSTPERARDIVQQARFAPAGDRGFSPVSKYNALERPIESLTKATYVAVQIEGREGIANIGAIAATPGVDAVFVGPYDLSLSLGVTPDHPDIVAAATEIAASTPEGVALGIYLDDPAVSAAWARRRYTLQCVSFDGRMLTQGARATVEAARASSVEKGEKR